MSYNVTGCEIVNNKNFRIALARYSALKAEAESEARCPETNIFDPGWLKHGAEVRGETVYVKHFWWGSGGSGYSMDYLREKVLPAFTGVADLIFTWEGGDSFTGMRAANGRVTEHEVIMALGPKKPAKPSKKR